MNEEVWKDIPGYENLYQASTLGRIRTHPHKTTYTELRGVRHWKTRILKSRGECHCPGKRASLWKDGKRKDFLQARLVAMTWVDGYSPDLTVNHINGDRMDNRPENLEWVTLRENIQHGFRTGLYKNVMRPIALRSKKTGEVIIFESMKNASAYLGKSRGFVSEQLKKGCSDFGEYEAVNVA